MSINFEHRKAGIEQFDVNDANHFHFMMERTFASVLRFGLGTKLSEVEKVEMTCVFHSLASYTNPSILQKSSGCACLLCSFTLIDLAKSCRTLSEMLIHTKCNQIHDTDEFILFSLVAKDAPTIPFTFHALAKS